MNILDSYVQGLVIILHGWGDFVKVDKARGTKAGGLRSGREGEGG
jgi:hypothetical protein